jgi:hypothetical protein
VTRSPNGRLVLEDDEMERVEPTRENVLKVIQTCKGAPECIATILYRNRIAELQRKHQVRDTLLCQLPSGSH